jgi:hypothetical protein
MNISDLNAQGLVYAASNQAAATVTLINTSTTTGFVLSNPWGSGKKLVLWNVEFNYTTVPAAAAIVFIATSIAPSPTAHASTTAVGVYSAAGLGASTTSVARAYSASTTPNLPVYTRSLGYSPTTPATTSGLTVSALLEGSLILVPGTYMQISYITTAPVGIGAAIWAEVPL